LGRGARIMKVNIYENAVLGRCAHIRKVLPHYKGASALGRCVRIRNVGARIRNVGARIRKVRPHH